MHCRLKLQQKVKVEGTCMLPARRLGCSCSSDCAAPPNWPVLVGSMKPPSSLTQSFCAAPDTRALFAVLGVVTHEKSGFRHSIRRSWLPSPEAGVVTRLVMRGFNASAAVVDEAAQFGDIVFLPSSASLSEYSGPLQSTWQWLECAVSAWPRAALIGKAEDDVWVHLPGVLESLRAGSEALGKFNLRSMYWGMVETCNAHPSEPASVLLVELGCSMSAPRS